MPYVARKEGDKYTVYKKKKDGKPGEKVGSTKGTKEALKKYMAALHMHENQTMKKSTLISIIQEEIVNVLKEATTTQFTIPEIKKIVEKNLDLNRYKIQREDATTLSLASKYKDVSIDIRLDLIPGYIWFGGFARIELSSVSLADPTKNYQTTSARRVVNKKINTRKEVNSYSKFEKLLQGFLTKVGELK